MSVRIGTASIDENGEIAGGKIGDQTGREIYERDWYQHKYPWNVYLECPDQSYANLAAKYMKEICEDPGHGYDQGQRTTGYVAIIQNGRVVKGTKGEWDCSSSVAGCYNLAGIKSLSINNTTRTLRKALLKTGKFVEYTDSSHLLSGKLSKVGGVYLSEGHHVVMVIENKIVQMPNTDKIYTVAKGDTLSAIAIRTGVTVANLVKWNGIKNPDEISIGQKLIIK